MTISTRYGHSAEKTRLKAPHQGGQGLAGLAPELSFFPTLSCLHALSSRDASPSKHLVISICLWSLRPSTSASSPHCPSRGGHCLCPQGCFWLFPKPPIFGVQAEMGRGSPSKAALLCPEHKSPWISVHFCPVSLAQNLIRYLMRKESVYPWPSPPGQNAQAQTTQGTG